MVNDFHNHWVFMQRWQPLDSLFAHRESEQLSLFPCIIYKQRGEAAVVSFTDLLIMLQLFFFM